MITTSIAVKFVKAAAYSGLVIGALVLVFAVVLLFFPDSFINIIVKPRLMKEFTKAYPAYSLYIGTMHYGIIRNSLTFDTLLLSAMDGTFSAGTSRISVTGIDRRYLINAGKHRLAAIASVKVEATGFKLCFQQSHYELRCERLRVSAPDSAMTADSIALHPSMGDEEYFRRSQFRKTRFNLMVPQCRMQGLAFRGLLQGKMYRAHTIRIQDAILDILVNKDKPARVETSSPLMPDDFLSSIKGSLRIDSLSITNGRLKYGERFRVGSKPAFITFDEMQVSAEGITNHADPGAVIVIHGQAKFMKAGTMKLIMAIPVRSPAFSFTYSGSLSGMDLSALNSYLETGEQIRIKAGVLQSASYEIKVISGYAGGYVRAAYRDLTFAVINKNTGSEKGFSDRIASFIANTFKICRNNMPDKSGLIKVGKVKFARKRDITFLQFAWFALRSGIKNTVGF